jgi:hypothetical protein
LAEADAPPLWDWPEAEVFESVASETEEPTDDLLVRNSGGGRAFLQAKFKVQLREQPGSPLGSALTQFVQQYRGFAGGPSSNDRLVLMTGPETSASIRQDLPRILERVRGLASDALLASAAVNREEERILGVISAHLSRVWKAATGSDPSDGDLKAICRLMRVSVFDLYNDGAQVQQAQGFLRTSVLTEASEAGKLWEALVKRGAQLAVAQARVDRQLLQKELSDLGFALQGTRSYRADIEKLGAHTSRTIERLSSLASIRGDDGEQIKIPRDAPEALGRILESQSVVVTGDPGAGKSATLYELVSALRDGRDVVVLASDSLGASSLGELRSELNLDHDVLDVLDNWPGTEPAFLVVDALDAARGASTQEALIELIGAVVVRPSRWRVGAAIRRFDLRYSTALQALFGSSSPVADAVYQSPEFSGLSHFNVPLLTDEELAQLEQLAARLHGVISNGTSELKELARVPFNLRVLADLVSMDVAAEELEPITTQLQLLDKYWQLRVLDSEAGGDALETVLRTACEEMVSQRAMKIIRSALQGDVAAGEPLSELLSNDVLTEETAGGEVRREVVAFSHHVLFDYAAARLFFRGTSGALLDRTKENPELLLIVRPSYELHFRHLWSAADDRKEFWDAAVALTRADGVPEVAKIIAPGVAAQLLDSPSDYAPLLDALDDSDTAKGEAAERLLYHLIGSWIVGVLGTSIPDDLLEPWARLAYALSERLRPAIAYPLRSLLMELTAKPERLTGEAREQVGQAARQLLSWAFAQTDRYHGHVLRVAVEAVARTIDSDPDESARLIRQILDEKRLKEHGFEEMPDLAREVKHLAPVDPALAAEIYAAAFDFEETSDEKTQMMGGVMALTSHRSQDYRMAHYALAKDFPDFLRANPKEGIAALASVRRAYSKRRLSRDLEDAFECAADDKTIEIEPDGSHVWDSNGLDHDDEVKMLDAFEEWVGEEFAKGPAATRNLLDLLTEESLPAALWRRVFLVGSKEPENLAGLLEPLLVCSSALTSIDLHEAIGKFIGPAFPHLSEAARGRVEAAIMAIAESADEEDSRGQRQRDRLLGCIDSQLESTSAKERLAELKAEDAVPPNEPPISMGEWTSSDFGEREVLSEEGVDVDSASNRRLQELEVPVEEFAKKHSNGSPPIAEVEAVLEPLQLLYDALQSADQNADAAQQDYAMGHASEAAEAISRSREVEAGSPAFQLASTILLDAATHRVPEPPEDPTSFDKSQSWGSPSPRIEAAGGLTSLASRDNPTPELLEAIERLSQDPHPAVRFHVIRRLAVLRTTAPEAMWEIAERAVADEKSTGVLQGLMVALPQMTLPDEQDRLLENAVKLYKRGAGDRPGAPKLRELGVELLADLYIWRGHEGAGEFVRDEVIANTASDPESSRFILHRIREPFTHGEVAGGSTADDAIRGRVIELVRALLAEAIPALHAHEESLKKRDQVDEGDEELERAKTLAQIVDSVAGELYFATGAFDESQNKPVKTTPEQRERLYREAGDILDTIATVSYPPITHHALETLEAFIPYDPRGVFLRIGTTIKAGQAGGYQTDTLAASLFVRLIERYLAEHRTLLQEDEECRQLLIEILDIFVEVGWPDARRLTYGLQDIFR